MGYFLGIKCETKGELKKVHLDGLNKFIWEGIIGTVEERAYSLANDLYCRGWVPSTGGGWSM